MVWNGMLHTGGGVYGFALFRFLLNYDGYGSWVACSVSICTCIGCYRIVDYNFFFLPISSHTHLLILEFAMLMFAELVY
ncbi:hypothetical protein L873DRAFT_1177339 [Choiromyces venosus 120613-1]|uniref:Uncharacterized protein n=1 Tax=Choiromyces venosus 120613-1 TaxID=1336337 RepID=A0A3N4KG62_9PEZI|nr:hypothetical protein L873DRAFT_1177339 [Choiromyces venosus 120613-1]